MMNVTRLGIIVALVYCCCTISGIHSKNERRNGISNE